MLKKLLMLFVAFALSMGVAFAAVDVNTADEPSLEAVKGLGPVKSKAIIDERTKNGPFKDADDLANRVKGLGAKSVANLEQAGLTIGGSSAPPTGAKPSANKTPAATATSAAPAKSTVKSTTAATAATSPAATTATTPAVTPAVTPDAASAAKGKKGSKKAKAADAASSSTTSTADAASGASGAKASKKSKKKKAASDAAAT